MREGESGSASAEWRRGNPAKIFKQFLWVRAIFFKDKEENFCGVCQPRERGARSRARVGPL